MAVLSPQDSERLKQVMADRTGHSYVDDDVIRVFEPIVEGDKTQVAIVYLSLSEAGVWSAPAWQQALWLSLALLAVSGGVAWWWAGRLAIDTPSTRPSTLLPVVLSPTPDREFDIKKLENDNRDQQKLLHNLLPEDLVARLRGRPAAVVDTVPAATVMVAQVVGFAELSATLPARDAVHILDHLVAEFDALTESHGVEKIKTLGETYVAACGVPEARADHAERVAALAIDMLGVLDRFNRTSTTTLELRIGLQSGPVVAGVIGTRRYSYDVWGKTVSVARQLQEDTPPGTIQVGRDVRDALVDSFVFESKGLMTLPGTGDLAVWLLKGRKRSSSAS